MSVLGGERYDGLVEKLAGKDLGGTGFGLGFDRTLEAAELLKLTPTLSVGGQILVTVFSSDTQKQTLQITRTLRDAGLSVDIYPAADKLEKQLKYADKKGIPYVVIQGPEEMSRNVVKLKNMATKTQEELTVEEVIAKLQAN
jgi:histidyl-tRNA synthetase